MVEDMNADLMDKSSIFAKYTLQSVEILYKASTSDHVPFVMTVDIKSLSEMNYKMYRCEL